MRVRLLVFRCFTHDSQRVLTAVCEFALVHVEPLLNIVLCRFDRHQAGGKLHVTVLADAEQGWSRTIRSFRFAMPQVYAVRQDVQALWKSNCTTTSFPVVVHLELKRLNPVRVALDTHF